MSSIVQSPLYSPHEQILIELVSAVPAGYVTSQLTLAAKIYGTTIPANAGSNISKILNNLLGRANIPHHRVLKNIPARPRNGLKFQVRDANHGSLLRTEGVAIDLRGRLTSANNFWDFTPECQRAYAANINATADGCRHREVVSASDSAAAAIGERNGKDIVDATENVADMDWIAEGVESALDELHVETPVV